MENVSLNFSGTYSCADGTGLSGDSVTLRYWSSEANSNTSLASAIISLCFIIVGLPCNLLIIFGILRQRLYSQPTYILLLNLAISDLLVCVLVLPFTVISGFAGEFILGSNDETRCRVCKMGITIVLFAGFSLHCLAALSVDRLVFIKFPLKYPHLVTAKGTAIAVVILWLINICLSILPLFGYGDIVYQKMIATCTMRFISTTRLAPNFHYIILVAAISIVPLSLIIISNVWIFLIVQRHIRKIYSLRGASRNRAEFDQTLRIRASQTKHHKQLQLIKVFGAIFVANALTWSPIILRSLLSAGGLEFSDWWHFVVFVSVMSFVVLHPIIQACLIPELRDYIVVFLRKVLCTCYKKSPHPKLCLCCHHTTNKGSSSSDKCLCECGGSCCVMLSVTVLPVRDELNNKTDNDEISTRTVVGELSTV